MEAKLSPNTSRLFRSLNHAYYKEQSARLYLQTDKSAARRAQREEEEVLSMKRLKKTDKDQSWDLRAVCEARGMDKDDIDVFLAHKAGTLGTFESTD